VPTVAIVGVGATASVSQSGRSALELAAVAAEAAAADAGWKLGTVDGLWACNPVGEPHLVFATLLGERLGLSADVRRTVQEAGAGPMLALRDACDAVACGRCSRALVVEADNRGTRRRLDPAAGPWWVEPDGAAPMRAVDGFAPLAALYARERGLSARELAAVPVASREWARDDPGAIRRAPVSVDDVLASPVVVEPLHRLDCCPVGDWSGALAVSRATRAAREVRVDAVAEAHGRLVHDACSGLPEQALRAAVAAALAEAGVTASEIDVAQVFDAFGFCVPLCLEALGVWQPAEVPIRLAAGELGRGARPAVNTNGGMLAHGNAHVRQLLEAVAQLRHEAGARQVPDARTAVVLAAGGVLSTIAVAVLSTPSVGVPSIN
jgi:acetyl-CoA acetyltransferase